jgi:DNA-binding GntR family transcriptional regulator
MEEKLVRISDLERLKAYLAKQGGKATCAAIEQAFGWASDKLADLVTASAGHVKRANLGRAAGVALIGSERGQRGSVPLYRDVRRVLELHNEFHDTFLRACGNERLHQIVQTMVAQFQRYRMIVAMPGRVEGAIDQHTEIIDAFRRRDPALAEKLVQKNALYGKKILLKELAKG